MEMGLREKFKWARRRWLWKLTGHIHSDREMLECIYDMYQGEYLTKIRGDIDNPPRAAPFVPIDLYAVATVMGGNAELIFGRLYTDMGVRYRHRSPTDPNITVASIFEPVAGPDRHVVNFPYLTAVLAGLKEQRRRDVWTVVLSIVAIVVAVASAVLQYESERAIQIEQPLMESQQTK